MGAAVVEEMGGAAARPLVTPNPLFSPTFLPAPPVNRLCRSIVSAAATGAGDEVVFLGPPKVDEELSVEDDCMCVVVGLVGLCNAGISPIR